MKSALTWTVGHSTASDVAPATSVPATVPGAVQLDWARAHNWGPHTWADNWRDYAWMEDVFWTYRAQLPPTVLAGDQRLFFVCRGIDYRFLIRCNGLTLQEQEGMFTPVELDLTAFAAAGGTLEVLVHPAPKGQGTFFERPNQSCKPPVSYGWDWHPRLVPLGIWDETYVEVRSALHLRDAEVRYHLADDFSRADLSVHVEASMRGGSVRFTLLDPAGQEVVRLAAPLESARTTLTGRLDRPQLWWPSTEGEPTLHTARTELLDASGRTVDTRTSRVGFRRVRLIQHPTQWSEATIVPTPRVSPPMTVEINGRPIFCRGSNWVNPEIFWGTITAETYRPLLEAARDAHFNLLRTWGGSIVNKESFFDQCDELGLMVWQEFPLACGNYLGTPEYLAVLDRESRSIIARVRRHACLALWCGGNELFNAWSGMDDQSLALRLLNRNCYDLDPHTPFIATSPLMNVGHGTYIFRYFDGREPFQVMPQASMNAYCEFGCAGLSPADYLRTFIPPDQLWPPKPGTAWQTHHAFNAWVGEHTWLDLPMLRDYFGESPDLDTLCERSSLLQCEGYTCIFEESRRQKPTCSMALNWCYNEPWPTAAGNSLLAYPAIVKPAYRAVQAACRPSLASARIPKFTWKAGETFTAELWLLHDAPRALPGGRIEAWLEADGQDDLLLLGWDFASLADNTNLAGPTLRIVLPAWSGGRMRLSLRGVDRPELTSTYTLLLRA